MSELKEIGGYLEFEHYSGVMLHEEALKLNSARNALAYLIKAKEIRKIILPKLLCDCIEDICAEYGVQIRYYHVGFDFHPEQVSSDQDEWVYIINFYGQLKDNEIRDLHTKYERIIIDNAQAYFNDPIEGIDTLYSCRKFLGVPDGGLLYTDAHIDETVENDLSHQKLAFLAGRLEKSASEFYDQYVINENHFYGDSLKLMSLFTENILHSFDYDHIRSVRENNFKYLQSNLEGINQLNIVAPKGPFMYPLMVDKADELREYLISNKVYVPVLWKNVIEDNAESTTEYSLASKCIPLPVDQRYGIEDMKRIVELINNKKGIIS